MKLMKQYYYNYHNTTYNHNAKQNLTIVVGSISKKN